jgi:hypothetical protein
VWLVGISVVNRAPQMFDVQRITKGKCVQENVTSTSRSLMCAPGEVVTSHLQLRLSFTGARRTARFNSADGAVARALLSILLKRVSCESGAGVGLSQ